MRITVHAYRTGFVAPLKVGSVMHTMRRGLIVSVEKDGIVRYGEAAPLDGYSPETFDQAREHIRAAADRIRREGSPVALDEDFYPSIPSIRCAFQFALGDIPEAAPSGSRVETARLLTGGAGNDLIAQALTAMEDGFTCLKIKVGRGALSDDIDRATRLQRELPADIRLRYDANRAWTLDDALRFCSVLDPLRTAFVEEPLRERDAYVSFDRHTPVPFALDESLAGMPPGGIPHYRMLGALVLKPSLLGGPHKVMPLAAEARVRNVDCILGSMYESGVGMRCLLSLATHPCFRSVPVGFDTYGALASDIVEPALHMQGPYLSPATGGSALRFKDNHLEKLYDTDSLPA